MTQNTNKFVDLSAGQSNNEFGGDEMGTRRFGFGCRRTHDIAAVAFTRRDAERGIKELELTIGVGERAQSVRIELCEHTAERMFRAQSFEKMAAELDAFHPLVDALPTAWSISKRSRFVWAMVKSFDFDRSGRHFDLDEDRALAFVDRWLAPRWFGAKTVESNEALPMKAAG